MKQAAEGRKFVFEHTVGASSWQLAVVNKLLHVEIAERVNFDFCQIAMEINVQGTMQPVKKRTSVVTNSSRLAKALLQRQCPGFFEHANTMGGRIKQCEVYPDSFCELVCREVLSERTEDDRDITAEMIVLMSLEAPDSRLNIFNGPLTASGLTNLTAAKNSMMTFLAKTSITH